MPSGWAVHKVEGDKPTAKIGTYNPIEKTMTSLNGVVEDWSTVRLVGNRGGIASSKIIGKSTKTKTKKWKSATNKLKSVSAFKQRRRSSLMTSSTEIDLVSSVNIHVDKATGRKYSVNAKTGVAEWLDEAVEEAVHVDPASGRRYNSKGWL